MYVHLKFEKLNFAISRVSGSPEPPFRILKVKLCLFCFYFVFNSSLGEKGPDFRANYRFVDLRVVHLLLLGVRKPAVPLLLAVRFRNCPAPSVSHKYQIPTKFWRISIFPGGSSGPAEVVAVLTPAVYIHCAGSAACALRGPAAAHAGLAALSIFGALKEVKEFTEFKKNLKFTKF